MPGCGGEPRADGRRITSYNVCYTKLLRSCANRQPWRFVIVEKTDPARPALEESLDPGNGWARKAPVLIVAGARREDGSVVESREYHHHDTGLATMSLV